MARSWLWRKANFDGASFYVDASELSRGRRLVIHEYPGGERHDVEDMGRKAGKIELTAYFVSETADIDSAALRARVEQGGAGMLVIPMFGAMRVRAIEGRPVWNRQALNYVGFKIEFVEEGDAFAPMPLGLGAAQLAFMGSALGAIVGAAITENLAGAAQVNFLRADMNAQAVIVADAVETLRASLPLPETVDGDVKVAIADARRNLIEETIDAAATIEIVANAVDVIATEQMGGDPAGILQDMVDETIATRNALQAQWGVLPLVGSVPIAAGLVYAAQAVRLLGVRGYRDRASAQAARTQISVLAAKVVDLYDTLSVEAQMAFDEFYGAAARHLSNQIPDLAPVIIVELGASLPSNVLAYRLYGDPNRGLELAQRNRVATPCMMPTVFEAAAR